MGFFAMIASMLLGILFVVIGISRRKQKGWPIILIALGILFVLIAIYLGYNRLGAGWGNAKSLSGTGGDRMEHRKRKMYHRIYKGITECR